ncbi:M20/M25/M40 family metallo-hydrolase [Panacibacter ginsenosidivorans]|uniref:M20/M25/M40 family metallo-hydrolase n=1 Tax=Panacibacter ginsenosidivorans TaxID=1813871 RepID=A0A5B8VA86_9BACT|nr:M20 family metallo-hydrolase [Panacibacter ginsenosidivorans]QEC68262.1 M20/M25/M40 family metallo-hydrolase [Panacibacter ginsenosidivorans]
MYIDNTYQDGSKVSPTGGDLMEAAIDLLKKLISTPSFSKEEDNTAEIIDNFLDSKGITTYSYLNNIWAKNKFFDESKPTIVLNSHHDTVKPNKAYTLDPFTPIEKDGKLYGLGSNDAGGCLVSLIATFIHYYKQENLKYNLLIAASAEEEISGHNGIEILLPRLPKIDFGIVGEPTLMNMAVAEKGLLVLDCITHGRAGHAAREEGENAIYKALKDIEWFRTYKYDKVSDLLGPMKMSVTIINAGSQHNVVPHECKFTVDVRVNELYTFEEVLGIIKSNVSCDVQPRSSRLRSTSIALDHPLIKAGIELGRSYYGSPTTSDKALMNFPTLKMGPGDSARSHTADEFIYVDEIRNGINLYIKLLDKILL